MNRQTLNKLLGDLSSEQFLSEYWQKKPLLIRNALPAYNSPISADELAGLACDEEVESRLVLEEGGSKPWELRCGPFDEDEFCSLPATHWTLLVQEANKHLPQLAPLLAKFNFIPSWWFDDIMISYAPDKGSVGPHYDQYDVFLLQVEGKKNWKISTQAVNDCNYLDNTELRIMKQFEAEHEWELQPGDMLYLPPGVAHHGVAVGDSMTFSIGYRALSQSEMLTSFIDFSLEQRTNQHFYRDPDHTQQLHPGEITEQTISHVTELLNDISFDKELVGNWFAQYVTESSHHDSALTPPDLPYSTAECQQQLASCGSLCRSELCRFNFIRTANNEIELFIAGRHYHFNEEHAAFAMLICDQTSYQHHELTDHLHDSHCLRLLQDWVNCGILYFPYDD